MQLNESKTYYIIFSKYMPRHVVADERQMEKKTRELWKGGYARIQMLTKLKYSGTIIEDLIHLYKQFVREKLEFSSFVWHSTLTER